MRQVLERRVELDLNDADSHYIFQYLVDKRMIGESARSAGRYRGMGLAKGEDGGWHGESRNVGILSRFPVYQSDIWLAHPDVPSTIGVPTPDNVGEVVGLAFQLQVLDRSKNSWTSTGQLVDALRRLTADQLPDASDPFLLGSEAAAILRSLLERDGLVLREVARFLHGFTTVRRDEVAAALPSIVDRGSRRG